MLFILGDPWKAAADCWGSLDGRYQFVKIPEWMLLILRGPTIDAVYSREVCKWILLFHGGPSGGVFAQRGHSAGTARAQRQLLR